MPNILLQYVGTSIFLFKDLELGFKSLSNTGNDIHIVALSCPLYLQQRNYIYKEWLEELLTWR